MSQPVAMFPYSVNNIKVSYKVVCPSLPELLSELSVEKDAKKTTNNFFVLRQLGFVYVIFYTGHVNCTKLKTLDDVEKSKQLFLRLSVKCEVTNCRIDNITASGKVSPGSRLNLFSFCSFLKKEGIAHNFDPHKFPGLNFKLMSVTFILFNSGKFILVGGKSVTRLHLIINVFSKYIEKFLEHGPVLASR